MGSFVGWSDEGDGDENDGEGDEGTPKGEGCDARKEFAVAVEEGGEGVDYFVGDEDHPWFDDPVSCR